MVTIYTAEFDEVTKPSLEEAVAELVNKCVDNDITRIVIEKVVGDKSDIGDLEDEIEEKVLDLQEQIQVEKEGYKQIQSEYYSSL